MTIDHLGGSTYNIKTECATYNCNYDSCLDTLMGGILPVSVTWAEQTSANKMLAFSNINIPFNLPAVTMVNMAQASHRLEIYNNAPAYDNLLSSYD